MAGYKWRQPGICEQCGKHCKNLSYLKHHQATHVDTKDYECHYCGKKFKGKKLIRIHLYMYHSDFEDATLKRVCRLCNPPRRFRSRLCYENHRVSHFPDKKFPCPHCNRWFKAEMSMKDHVYKFHSDPTTQIRFKCDQCPYESVSKNNFNLHKWVHVPDNQRPFQCDFCGKGFSQRAVMLTHRKRIHLGIKPAQCPQCGKGFGSNSDLKDHIRLHTGEQPYECHVCNAKFGDRKKYRHHMLAHEAELGTELDKSLRKFDKSFAPREEPV